MSTITLRNQVGQEKISNWRYAGEFPEELKPLFVEGGEMTLELTISSEVIEKYWCKSPERMAFLMRDRFNFRHQSFLPYF